MKINLYFVGGMMFLTHFTTYAWYMVGEYYEGTGDYWGVFGMFFIFSIMFMLGYFSNEEV